MSYAAPAFRLAHPNWATVSCILLIYADAVPFGATQHHVSYIAPLLSYLQHSTFVTKFLMPDYPYMNEKIAGAVSGPVPE